MRDLIDVIIPPWLAGAPRERMLLDIEKIVISAARNARADAFEAAAQIADENAEWVSAPQYHRDALLTARQIAAAIRVAKEGRDLS
jgi:hypothetical protein